jgi:hypothetical protein
MCLIDVRKKIGSLGTARDAVEYANRVPREIFTKDVAKSLLNSLNLYQLSKYFEEKVLLQLFTL